MEYMFQGVLALMVLAFVIYVALELRSLWAARANKSPGTAQPLPALSDTEYPSVSVLLPIYNEKLVVGKLLHAVAALDYPRDRLEILVLDDSTDKTKDVLEQHVSQYQAEGIHIRHVRRENRIGYKAGNLIHGLGLSTGDYIAIFDADCLPPKNFLRQTIPHFTDAKVGFLQTAVGYANADKTFLTRFQAMEAGHKEHVTVGLSREGCMASLTGSSCVWRRSCIEAIGGISTATITEDVDLGYRAQFGEWKYVFVPEVTSLSELPETMGAFRIQRQRWARGLVDNALRHVREMFATRMPLTARLQALALMFSSLLLAAFYALILLALPMAFVPLHYGAFFNTCCTIFLLTALAWACGNTTGHGGKRSVPTYVLGTFAYVVMYFPLSLYYFTATVQIVCGQQGKFYRTPKGSGRERIALPAINAKIIALEILTLLYTITTILVSLHNENYWLTLYAFLATCGFAMTLFFSWSDSNKKHLPRHVLITGATGAIGGALAKAYAAPGMKLTLQGRKRHILEALSAECTSKGAQVTIHDFDLRDTATLQAWIETLCQQNIPDLVIANAGRNTDIGPDNQGEPFTEVKELVEVNLLANMALVDAILPYMRKRHDGQIALMSSLAAYYGLALNPTYCATKSALKTWGQGLRGWLHKEGIKINVILPGNVSSPMCDAMPGPKPFLWQPEKAAQTIKKGLERDWARISFPFPLNLGAWGLSLLPACLAMPIARVLGYER